MAAIPTTLAGIIQALVQFKPAARQVRSAELSGVNTPTPILSPGAPLAVDPAGSAQFVASLAAQALKIIQTNQSITTLDIKNRISLTKNADDKYGGNLATAIAAATNPSAVNPWIVDILSPGEYGAAILPEHVYLTAGAIGPSNAVIITSDSGDTLVLPHTNSGIWGVTVRSTSPNPADAAVRVVASDPTSRPSIINTCILTSEVAPCLSTTGPTGGTSPLIVFNSDINGTGIRLIEALGAGIVVSNGGITQYGTGGGLYAGAGSFTLWLSGSAATNGAPGTWMFDSEGGTIVFFDTKTIGISLGMRGRSGATLILADVTFASPPTTVLDLDATSFAVLGTVVVNGASPYSLITATVPSNVMYLVGLDYLEGTTAGPDTRPPFPKPGMTFLGLDLLPVPVVLTFTSLGWMRGDGTIEP